jgi:hypothetical protein
MTSLQVLSLRGTDFDGPLPIEWSELTQLRYL